jgi:hypothetical protein
MDGGVAGADFQRGKGIYSMRNFLTRVLPVVAICVFVAWAVDVKTDYDHKVDFSKYQTYSWLGVKASNSLWEDRIRSAVDSALTGKGWTKKDSGGDASVAAVGTTSAQPTYTTFYNGFPGWYWQGWDGLATTTVDYDKVGTLVVDLFDSPTKKLIWRATATDTLSSKPDKNDKKLEQAVEKMFDKFPPKSKG